MSIPATSWAYIPPPGTQPPPPGMPMNNTAYTPVQVRQGFGNSMTHNQHFPPLPTPQQPAPVAPDAAKKKAKVDWPASVRLYVQRSFDPANMVPDVSRHDMETKLKYTISAATDNNTLFSTDWDNMPLPQNMIRAERAMPLPFSPWQQSVSNLSLNSPVQVPASLSKKRKSYETNGIDENDSSSPPPWRTTNNQNALEDRVTLPPNDRLEKRAQRFGDNDQSTKATSKFQKNLEKRQKRFDGGYKSTYRSPSPSADNGPVIGRCQTLEKKYFRLTAAPNPDHVRPLPILKQTLDLLKKKWKKESNYGYVCDQFKSMRQDLTVQHIKNEFTVSVYEIHARIALENADLGEYNQCQTQLRALYAQKLGGHPVEFKAYRILYFIYTCNRTSLNDVLADLTPAEKEEAPIKHALNVRSSLALGNYHKFFRLYLDTPNMGAYLMDMFVVRERLAAMSNICKAYGQTVKLRFITEELGFESDADAATFLYEYGGQTIIEERSDAIHVLIKNAGSAFETAKQAAFRKVDIKGQI